jgi:hypothetical protein
MGTEQRAFDRRDVVDRTLAVSAPTIEKGGGRGQHHTVDDQDRSEQILTSPTNSAGTRSNMHGPPVEWRHRVNDINHSRPRDGTRILPVVDQGGNHRAVDGANQC